MSGMYWGAYTGSIGVTAVNGHDYKKNNALYELERTFANFDLSDEQIIKFVIKNDLTDEKYMLKLKKSLDCKNKDADNILDRINKLMSLK